MAMFIRVDLDPALQGDAALCKALVEACPVDIFKSPAEGQVVTVEENLDECTLCDLCLQACRPYEDIRSGRLYE